MGKHSWTIIWLNILLHSYIIETSYFLQDSNCKFQIQHALSYNKTILVFCIIIPWLAIFNIRHCCIRIYRVIVTCFKWKKTCLLQQCCLATKLNTQYNNNKTKKQEQMHLNTQKRDLKSNLSSSFWNWNTICKFIIY